MGFNIIVIPASSGRAIGLYTVTSCQPHSHLVDQLRGRMAWALYATLNDSVVTAACVARSRDE